MDVATSRSILDQALQSIRELQDREADLERRLAAIRRRREAMDTTVQLAVKSAELADLEPAQWRELLNGRHSEIAAACGRASLHHS